MKRKTQIKVVFLLFVGWATYWAWPKQIIEKMAWAIQEDSLSGPFVEIVFQEHPYWTSEVYSDALIALLKRTKPETVHAIFLVSNLKHLFSSGPVRLVSIETWEAERYLFTVTSTCDDHSPFTPCGPGRTFPQTPSPFYVHKHTGKN